MDLTFGDDQLLLRDSAARVMADFYSFEKRSALLATTDGFSRELWATFADLGWLALSLPEATGGLAGSALDIGILMESFGKALSLEPFLSTAILSASLVAKAATHAQQAALLPDLIAGRSLLAFAHSEAGTRLDPTAIATRATRTRNGWTLSGDKVMVVGAPTANSIIVSALLGTGPAIGLFVIAPDNPGLSVRPFAMLDGRRAGNMILKDAPVDEAKRLAGVQDACLVIDECLDRAVVAASAMAVGCAQALLSKTVEFLKARVQFGEPLSSKQVLRHRVADMALRLEEATACALRAALVIDGGATVTERALVASAAKVKVARSARYVAEQAIQLHGGMGVTEELDIGSYFRSIIAFELQFGSVDYHRCRYAQLRAAQPGRPRN
jgi:alkylation response protein AidB-like acyl-CoA dehydrogenase